jgi:hypothetical protein
VSPYLLLGRRMAFLAQHLAVVDFLDLMSIVPDLRLEQIVVQPGSKLDGTILAIRRATGESIGCGSLGVTGWSVLFRRG